METLLHPSQVPPPPPPPGPPPSSHDLHSGDDLAAAARLVQLSGGDAATVEHRSLCSSAEAARRGKTRRYRLIADLYEATEPVGGCDEDPDAVRYRQKRRRKGEDVGGFFL